jgi:hypothetical protein
VIFSLIVVLFLEGGSMAQIPLWDQATRLMWGAKEDWQRGFSISSDGSIFGVVAVAFPGEARFGTSLIVSDGVANATSRRLSAPGTGGENPVLLRASSRRLHAAWVDTHQKESIELVAAFSEDGGKTWTESRLPAGAASFVPEIAEDSAGRLYLCFSSLLAGEEGNRIFLFRSFDKGESWVFRDVNFREKNGTTGSPRVKTFGKRVLIMWLDQSLGGAVVANVSEDGGESWLADPVVIGKANVFSAPYLEVVTSGEKISAFWKIRRDRETSVYRSDSADGGKTWSPGRGVLTRPVPDISCRVIPLKEELWIFWTDERGLQEVETSVYYRPARREAREPFEMPVVKESIGYLTGFDVVAHREGFVAGAVIRASLNRWNIVSRTARRDGSFGDLVEVVSTVGKERNGLLLVDLGKEVGFLYQEGEPRRLPMQTTLRESIVLSRLNLENQDVK